MLKKYNLKRKKKESSPTVGYFLAWEGKRRVLLHHSWTPYRSTRMVTLPAPCEDLHLCICPNLHIPKARASVAFVAGFEGQGKDGIPQACGLAHRTKFLVPMYLDYSLENSVDWTVEAFLTLFTYLISNSFINDS